VRSVDLFSEQRGTINFRPLSVGEKFVVIVSTESGGCTKAVETEVKVDGLRAEIRPYNQTRRELWTTTICTLVLVTNYREIPLRFDTPGMATIQVFGQSEHGPEMIRERQIEVR
jgi:hypothetical protein